MATQVSPRSTPYTVKSPEPVDAHPRDYLTEREMERFLNAPKQGRHGSRDYAMVLPAYRHGLRVWFWARERHLLRHLPYVFQSVGGPCTWQMFKYQVVATGRRAGLLLHVHPHMLRHSCGYALANQGHDTRLIQDYLGHRTVQHTVRYTRTASTHFEGLWR